MSRKILFVVVALVVLVATFCVSFAGVPLAQSVDVPVIGNSTGLLTLPRNFDGAIVTLDMDTAQNYSENLANAGYSMNFNSFSGNIQIFYFVPDVGWVYGNNVSSVTIEAVPYDDFYFVGLSMLFVDGGSDTIPYGLWQLILSDDVIFTVTEDGVDITSVTLSTGIIGVYGYFMSIEEVNPPTLGQIVVDNIVDTLWGTLVSVGKSFGIGLNQMVGELFFDLETGELAPFSIVIICFFALCLIISIVNWLFRLAHLKKL